MPAMTYALQEEQIRSVMRNGIRVLASEITCAEKKGTSECDIEVACHLSNAFVTELAEQRRRHHSDDVQHRAVPRETATQELD
jgi:hypothetical protein